MKREFRAEKHIRIVSWLTWKLSAITSGITALIITGVVLASFLFQKKLNAANQAPMWVLLLALTFGLLICWLYWKVGKALDRFRPWARNLTVVIAVLNLFYPILQFLLDKGKNPLQSLGLHLTVAAVVYSICFYVLWALLNRRARKVFSKEYQHHLRYNSFDRF